MKTILTFIILLLSAEPYSCQMTWAPAGATWHFNFSSMCMNGYNKIEADGDSIVGGQLCARMRQHISGYDCGGMYSEFELNDEFTYSDADYVYHWTGQNFEILYDFTLQPGDIYTVGAYQPCAEGDSLLVTETGTTTINGFTLRYYEVELLNNFMGEVIFGRIIERIGPVESFLFPLPRCLPDFMLSGPFRCYADDAFGAYSSDIVAECDYLRIAEEMEQGSISLFPNPAIHQLTIQSQAILSVIEVSDATGRILFSLAPNLSMAQINTESLSSGFYYLNATMGNGSTITRMFFVN
jgi:hypothetical protein